MKDGIRSLLPQGHPWGELIHHLPCTDSTNTRARELALSGAPEGTVVLADSQSAGRGRLGRQFHSPVGSGIYMSVILRPHCPPTELMHLTCAVAVAVCDAVESAAGFRPKIKWINDLVVGKKKLAGILTELSLTAGGLVDFVVVGIGINCNQQPEEFPPALQSIACSAAMVTGRPVDRERLAAAMIEKLETTNRRLLPEKAALMARYRLECVTLGAEVRLERSGEVRQGTALDIDGQGALLVRFSDGHTETVNSGEVSVRGLWDYV